MTTFLLEHALFGKRPLGYHLNNVLIHVANVILLFLFARRLRVSESAGLWAALFFAAHPAIAEAVHWVNGRSDSLCLLFVLAALIAWLVGRDLAAALLVFMGTLCKETAFLLLPPFLLLRRYRAGSPSWRVILPLATGALAGLALRLIVFHRLAIGSGWSHFRHGLARLPEVWLDGLTSLLAPVPTMPAALYEQYRDVSIGTVVAACAVFALLVGAAVWAARRGRPLYGFALATFSLTVAPVTLLTFTAGWSGWGRYLYPSAPFVCLALSSLVVDEAIPRTRPLVRKLALGFAAALVAVFCVVTCLHGGDWKNDRAFAEALIRDHADQSFGYAALIVAELDHDPARAVAAAQRALAIDPSQARHWSLAANALMRADRRQEAYVAARRGLAIDPNDVNCQYVLGIARLAERREREAARLLMNVLVAVPDQPSPWQTVREAARRLGPSSAFVAALRSLSAQPQYASITARLAPLLELR
jgi:tetratricopeptide (TPR) repeat protein